MNDYRGPERRAEERDRVGRLGRWLLERANLLALLVVITYLILGVISWGVAQTNHRTKEELRHVETLLQRVAESQMQNRALIRLIEDCSTPGGECFEEQLRNQSVADVLDEIADDVGSRLGCVLLVAPEARTEDSLRRCGIDVTKARQGNR